MHYEKFFINWYTLLEKNVKIAQNYLKHSDYDSYLPLCI